MMRTVGRLSPAVYWRRRLVLLGGLALLVVLFVLTVKAVSGGGGTPAGAANSSSSSASSTSHQAVGTSPRTTHSATQAARNSSHPSSVTSSAVPAAPCTAAQLKLVAVAGSGSYAVGSDPLVMLQVTNSGPKPCVQGLGSKDVELRVYNGESRVWGSNDCSPDATPVVRTLAVNSPVRVSVVWSGLTSQPHCAGTRQRVGAGTYTLYALLDGHNARASQFAIS